MMMVMIKGGMRPKPKSVVFRSKTRWTTFAFKPERQLLFRPLPSSHTALPVHSSRSPCTPPPLLLPPPAPSCLLLPALAPSSPAVTWRFAVTRRSLGSSPVALPCASAERDERREARHHRGIASSAFPCCGVQLRALSREISSRNLKLGLSVKRHCGERGLFLVGRPVMSGWEPAERPRGAALW